MGQGEQGLLYFDYISIIFIHFQGFHKSALKKNTLQYILLSEGKFSVFHHSFKSSFSLPTLAIFLLGRQYSRINRGTFLSSVLH
jgi:hypothetical protein